jgi:hypothetical protein
MLTHHSNVDYKEAASEAGKRGRDRLQAMIDTGRERGQALVEALDRQIIDDRVVRGTRLSYKAERGGIQVVYGDGTPQQGPDNRVVPGRERVHRHALGQIANAYGVPVTYLNKLHGEERMHDLLGIILTHHAHLDPQRRLVRSVNGEARGFLSDKYKRIDPRPVLAMFIRACQQFGAVPFSSYVGETKFELKAILQRVFEPVEGEVLSFGVSYKASSFGAGAEELSLFIDRIWCTNLCAIQTPLRKVHIGTRIEEGIDYTRETVDAETRALALMVRDVTTSQLRPERINMLCDAVRDADAKKLSGLEVEKFLKKNLSVGEADEVTNLYAREADIEVLPRKESAWRLSNAISWFAQTNEKVDGERRLELEALAGELVPLRTS